MIGFSVLASVYEKVVPDHLDCALYSIYNQTLPPNEVVLVKDGPLTGRLDKIIQGYQSKYVKSFKVIELEKNGGLGKALRVGLLECSYEVVFRMDMDDICVENRFEKQLTYLINHPEVTVLGGAVEEFENKIGDLGIYRRMPTDYKNILRFAKFRNPLNHPTVAFRKSAILEIGSYEEMLLFEDYYLWIRLLSKGKKIENLPDILLYFRIGNDMVGRRHGLSYLRKEFFFYLNVWKSGYITNAIFFIIICVRLPLRLIPKKVLELTYSSVLRKKYSRDK